MKVKQAYLVSHETGGKDTLTMTTWLDVRPGLVQGALITLKDFPNVLWNVKELYDQEHDAADFDWHRKWDNNI